MHSDVEKEYEIAEMRETMDVYQPPILKSTQTSHSVEEAEKVHNLFYEILRYLLFLYLVLLITYGLHDETSYYVNASVKQ